MSDQLSKRTKNSLWLFSSGIVIIAMGIYVWLNPHEAFLALSVYIGIILLISGIGYFTAFLAKSSSWYLSLSLLNILLSIIFIFSLGVSAETLPVMFAFWAIFVGVLQVASSYHHKRKGWSWIFTVISGIFGILFGYLVILYPFVGTIAITILMGLYMILYGAMGMAECTVCWRGDDED